MNQVKYNTLQMLHTAQVNDFAHEDAREYLFVASTGREDRNGNILDPDGWDLTAYKRNPVVTYAHHWNEPPIGQARVWLEPGALMAAIKFAHTARGLEAEQLVSQNILRSVSVGWLPIRAELRRDENGFPIGIHFHQQELVEISLPAVPANPDTIRVAATTPETQNTTVLEALHQLTLHLKEHLWTPQP